MSTLVIKSFPDELHAKLKEAAAEDRRSVTQQAIVLLEQSLNSAKPTPPKGYWRDLPMIPEFAEADERGAFSGGVDSTAIISEERDAR